MNGYQYILAKQVEWAKNQRLDLIGSKIDRGRPTYTTDLDSNLFQPLLPDVRRSFESGDGSELGSQVSTDIHFEEKYPIKDDLAYHPSIDVVIHNSPAAKIRRFAIECKFSEAYGGRQHGGLAPKYLEHDDIWTDLPNLRFFSERISPDDEDFRHLHPAQLVKHILGLNRQFGLNGFRLLYLWYDVLGKEGKRHREEVGAFSVIAKGDGIKFHSLTYQELICKLASWYRNEHPEYVQYLTSRYL